MGLWLDAASTATALNVCLLLVLLSIWGRNYLEFRSKHTVGWSLFAILLLIENLLSLYYYVLDPTVAAVLNDAAPVRRAGDDDRAGVRTRRDQLSPVGDLGLSGRALRPPPAPGSLRAPVPHARDPRRSRQPRRY